MRSFVIAVSSTLSAVLFTMAAKAAEPPPPPPSAAPSPPPSYAPPPPAYSPPPYAPAGYAPPVQPAGPAPYPYAAPAYYEVPPQQDPYDVRFPKKSGGIFISPLAILGGTLGAELDLKTTSAMTLNIGGNYTSTSLRTFDRNGSSVDAAAWAVDVGPQIFPLGRAFNQLYVYPRFLYARAWGTSTDPTTNTVSATASAIGFATTVGYQWTYTAGFSLRLGAGIGYYSAQGNDTSSTTQVRLSGLMPALDASLGWTF